MAACRVYKYQNENHTQWVVGESREEENENELELCKQQHHYARTWKETKKDVRKCFKGLFIQLQDIAKRDEIIKKSKYIENNAIVMTCKVTLE